MFGWIHSFVSALFAWLTYVFFPISVIRDCLKGNLQDSPVRVMGGFWIAPVILMLVTNALILHFYGIELNSNPYLAIFYLVIPACGFVVEALILFVVLRAFGVKATLGLVFLCFSMFVIYAPINSWAQIANAIRSDELLVLLKSQHLSLSGTVLYLFQHATEINEQQLNNTPLPKDVYYYAGMASGVIYLLSATLVAECVSQMLELQRPMAYLATAVVSAINLIPGIFLSLVQASMTFAFAVPRS
jgi:hypothetical protein